MLYTGGCDAKRVLMVVAAVIIIMLLICNCAVVQKELAVEGMRKEVTPEDLQRQAYLGM
jgi:hypothetical protein